MIERRKIDFKLILKIAAALRIETELDVTAEHSSSFRGDLIIP